MPDQDMKPKQIEESVELHASKDTRKISETLIWLVPLVIVIVVLGIVLLAALGPAMGHVYSGFGDSL